MIKRKLRKQIEGYFYRYEIIVSKAAAEIADSYEDIIFGKTVSGGGSDVSKPTESKALKLVGLSDDFKWCYVVERTLEYFNKTGKDELIRLKYFQHLKWYRICEKLHIEKASIYFWLDDIINHAAMIAIQLGLLKII